ncbi:MAG TPA: VTT domain-containing protein [Candidatus Norongarragalinales archaeon]|nr:VTT domain-containing protein [Candidatus Norongarragalinales archaeon]
MFDQITTLLHQLYDVESLIRWGGYAVLVFIVFAETGLLFGFFFPGDSLLVTAGILASSGLLDIWTLNLLLVPAAILGDATGYYFGKKAGKALYSREDSRFFRKEHVLRAKEFYDKHGGKTIILARFIPAVRTFAPIVAGVSGMSYPAFAMYNIVGGILWVSGLTLLGFLLGKTVPDIEKNLLIVIGVVIAISFLPAIWEYRKHRKGKKKD